MCLGAAASETPGLRERWVGGSPGSRTLAVCVVGSGRENWAPTLLTCLTRWKKSAKRAEGFGVCLASAVDGQEVRW